MEVIVKPHMEYSLMEYREMDICNILTNFHYNAASNLFRDRNPNLDRYPDQRVFQRLEDRMRRSGSLVPTHDYGGRKKGTPAELENLILDAFDIQRQGNPNLSTKVAAIRLGTSQTTVWRILDEHGFHPFHYQSVQALMEPLDFINRVNFCNHLLAHTRIPGFNLVRRLFYTDECTFTTNGMFNHRNYVHWSDANPR